MTCLNIALAVAAALSAVATAVIAWYACKTQRLQKDFNDWVKSEAQPVPHALDCYPTVVSNPPQLRTKLRFENPGKNTVFIKHIQVADWGGVPPGALPGEHAYPQSAVPPTTPQGPWQELPAGAVPPRTIRELSFESKINDLDLVRRAVQAGGDLYYWVAYVSGGKEGNRKIGPYKALD